MGKKSTTSQSKVYVVQDILDTKIINGLQHYRVKWKGYSFSECTWQPEQSFNCSRQILNQFLQSRAEKEPSFKDKLQKISKDKDINLKNKSFKTSNQREKTLTENDSKQEFFDKQNQNTEVKREWDSNVQDQNIDIKYGYELKKNELTRKQQRVKQQSQPQVKKNSAVIEQSQKKDIIGNKLNSETSYESQKLSHKKTIQKKVTQKDCSDKNQKGQKEKSLKSIEKDSNCKKIHSNQQKLTQDKKDIQILSVKLINEQLSFIVRQNGRKVTKNKQEMHGKYAVQLCQYYERFITFDD